MGRQERTRTAGGVPGTTEEDDSGVRLERRADGVAAIVLHRPHRGNSLDRAASTALLAALTTVAQDPTVRVVLLRGEGGTFCSGDDIHTAVPWLEGDDRDFPADRLTGDVYYTRICEAILGLPKPVVAAIDGTAAGAGTEIACAADLRLWSSRGRMGSCLVGVGHVGNAVMLTRVAGPARATEIYLTGRLVEAEEALRIGLADSVVPHDCFETELDAALTRLAAAPTRAIGLFKELRERTRAVPAEQALRLQNAFHWRTYQEVEDGTEGILAFAERRRPRFTGS
jgi:2-(1,2-epoxy-1,2-dihydrophenyl)acetyl-CoA isomerase